MIMIDPSGDCLHFRALATYLAQHFPAVIFNAILMQVKVRKCNYSIMKKLLKLTD
jgi:hypothetical protein